MSNSSPALLLLSVLVSGGVAFGVVALTRSGTETPDPHTHEIAALQKELADLRHTQAGMRGELQRLLQEKAAAPVSAPVGRTEQPTVSDQQVDAAVARWFAEHGGVAAADAAGRSSAVKFDPKAAREDMRKRNAWNEPAEWKKLHEAGHLDALLAEFERHAEANPNDPGAQMELANAYLATVQFDQTRWQLSVKADGLFDKVLTLDPNHWEARFTKAVSYSFWPDFLGKKKEAVAHFEHLVEQQKAMPVQDHQAQTYLFLGNLLEQRGERERALEIWRQGSQRHPTSQELRQRLSQ